MYKKCNPFKFILAITYYSNLTALTAPSFITDITFTRLIADPRSGRFIDGSQFVSTVIMGSRNRYFFKGQKPVGRAIGPGSSHIE